jgi:murein DD-endopeptidase MepM/ murein hydrolase activator NlpD
VRAVATIFSRPSRALGGARSSEKANASWMALLLRLSVLSAVGMGLMAGLLPFASPATTLAGEGILMPFPGGQAVRIIQGYNGGSHQGRSYYGLDLVLAGASTSGSEVVSPIDGSVAWAQAPGTANGCMALSFRDGSYSVVLCHVLFHRSYSRGEWISGGQSLGRIGPAGTVGNNGTPHVHLELHRGGRAAAPVPFSPPDGLPLEGVALPATGAYSEHTSRAPIASSNRTGSGAVAPSNPQAAVPRQPPPTRPAASEQTTATAPSSVAARSSTPTRTAVVHGTGSCLNVREQPSPDARIVDCLRDGTEVALMPRVQGGDSGWRKIEARGWAVSEHLKRTRAVVSGTEACLNVRESPSIGALVLGCLPEGTPVVLSEGPTLGGDFEWYRIEPAKPVEKGGWVVAPYLD